MRFAEGMSAPEIATVVNLKPKAIYARIGRLLKQIRRKLEGEGIVWDTLEPVVGGSGLAVDLERIFSDLSNRATLSV